MTCRSARPPTQLWLRDARGEELLSFFLQQKIDLDAGRPVRLLDGEAVGLGIARLALEEAEARPFADAYYWAPFIFVGL